MKKIITILVLLCFAGTTVFANSQPIVKDKAITSVKSDMFSDVEGSTLTENEMDETDGEGLGTIAVGAVWGGAKNYATQRFVEKKSNKEVDWKKVGKSAVIGGVVGATAGVGKAFKLFKKGRKAYKIYKKYGKTSYKIFKKFNK